MEPGMAFASGGSALRPAFLIGFRLSLGSMFAIQWCPWMSLQHGIKVTPFLVKIKPKW